VSDIALFWDDTAQAADFAIEENDLATDAGLKTAVMLSLFTDRQAEEGDVLPAGETDRRGWWGDAFPTVDDDKIGSRLWLLDRSTETPAVRALAEEYAHESLKWLLDDKVSDGVKVVVDYFRRGGMGGSIQISRPNLSPVDFRFDRVWAGQEATP